jgi:hypothetical protein
MIDQSYFQVDANPSFCNAWPELSISVNAQEIWRGEVSIKQTIAVEFKLQDKNEILIQYLNKNHGPNLWDTKLDSTGNIIEDQNCVLSNFRLGRSRCDFLLQDLDYYRDDGSVQSKPWGFMSQRGYFRIEFPRDVYSWIIACRKKYIFGARKQSSSLDYWTNYLGDPNDPITQELLQDIDQLLKKFDDQNTSN